MTDPYRLSDRRKIMKAAVVREFGQPLIIEDRPVPVPGPGEITVRMEASGLCHTDIHAAHGDWPVKPVPPFVPGHEGVGIVHATGAGVTSPAIGQRVAVPWLGYACGTCRHCLRGWETLCLKQRNSGYSVDGCYAEYFLAQAAFAAIVPAGLDPFEVAPLSCAGVTTYKAVKVANVRPAELVAISGVGGLGHLAIQYAKIFGGSVAAIDVTDEKLQLAKDLGADLVIDARSEDPAQVLQAHGGADVAIGLAVSEESFAAAYAGLGRGGRLVLVALPAAGTLRIPVFDTVLNGTSVIGSIVGTRADLADVFTLHADGRTRVIYETRPLGSVNESIRDVLRGRARARIVLAP
jgi:propanol-preferring alcohol dehydrogenase